MTLGMTIGERISQNEMLPKQGTLYDMVAFNELKKALVGFSNTQMINWRIMEYNGKLITAIPDQATSVTLSDEVVLAYAKYIKQRSQYGQIQFVEAKFCKAILDEAERLQPTEETEEA